MKDMEYQLGSFPHNHRTASSKTRRILDVTLALLLCVQAIYPDNGDYDGPFGHQTQGRGCDESWTARCYLGIHMEAGG